MALPSHAHKKHAPFPSRSDVLAFVELADTGEHWYWLGDHVHQAQEPWPVIKNEYGTWHVMRLLLPAAPGLHHVNACGLRTCVNPDHWRLEHHSREATVTNFDGTGWRRV